MIFIVLLLSFDVFAGAVAERRKMQQRQIQQKTITQKQRALASQEQSQKKVRDQSVKPSAVSPQAQVLESDEPITEITGEKLSTLLQKSSTVWPNIIDWEVKEAIVKNYIRLYKSQGTTLNLPAAHYIVFVETLLKQNPNMLQIPFYRLMMIAAVMEYDFNNGVDKDQLAKKILGEQGYLANKKRREQH